MATAPNLDNVRGRAPLLSETSFGSEQAKQDAVIAAAVLLALFSPLLLTLTGLVWLAISDPSTLWMLVALYFQIPGN